VTVPGGLGARGNSLIQPKHFGDAGFCWRSLRSSRSRKSQLGSQRTCVRCFLKSEPSSETIDDGSSDVGGWSKYAATALGGRKWLVASPRPSRSNSLGDFQKRFIGEFVCRCSGENSGSSQGPRRDRAARGFQSGRSLHSVSKGRSRRRLGASRR